MSHTRLTQPAKDRVKVIGVKARFRPISLWPIPNLNLTQLGQT